MNPPSTPPARVWTRNFVLAFITTLSAFSSFYFLLATLPVFILQIGGSESEVGLLIGVFSATSVLLRLPVGHTADRRGKKPFILAGVAIMLGCSVAYTAVTSVPTLLGLRVVHGVGWALFGTSVQALVADVVPPARRGEAMGFYGMSTNLAMAVGPALGVMLMKDFSFTVLFLACAGMALLGVVASALIREPPRPAAAAPAPGGGILAMVEKSAVLPGAVFTLVAMSYGSLVSFLPIYASKQGISNPGVFFTVYAVTLLTCRSYTGKLSDRYGRPKVIIPGMVLAAVALLLVTVAHSMVLLLVVAALYGLGLAALQPAMMSLVVDRAPPARRGAAMGTYSMAMDVGIGGGSLLWGVLAQHAGYETMYLAAAGAAVLALVAFLVGFRTRPAVVPGASVVA